VYVGSAKNLLHRKQHHFHDLKAGNHKNDHLQRAYNHYGPDAFLFGVIEHVEHVELLLTREQYHIDTLNPEYNIARTAGSNLGAQLTPETKAK
jgi:group I intron endonuclease